MEKCPSPSFLIRKHCPESHILSRLKCSSSTVIMSVPLVNIFPYIMFCILLVSSGTVPEYPVKSPLTFKSRICTYACSTARLSSFSLRFALRHRTAFTISDAPAPFYNRVFRTAVLNDIRKLTNQYRLCPEIDCFVFLPREHLIVMDHIRKITARSPSSI